MKSNYRRTTDYFRPLKSFRNSFTANDRQIALARNLNRSYGIPESNILRLIMYADIALSYATESEIKVYYSDLKEIADFEKEPVPIEKIIFRGSTQQLGYSKSFEITNPFLIDELYKSILNFLDFPKLIKEKKSKKKRPSELIIKKIATELYGELTGVEKVSEWKSLCIIGYIFALYKIGLKTEEPILTESEHKQQMLSKQVVSETYLQYLSGRIKRYII